MKIAYADPPYIGQAKRHYGCAEIDHRQLVDRLVSEFPDGWALSLSSPTLKTILALCPEDVRVAAWVKPFASFKKGVNPAYAWEPVIWLGGRRGKDRTRKWTVRDYVSCPVLLGAKRAEEIPNFVPGFKPRPFCFWLFDLLGLDPTDELVDLFPGSGAVTRAWEEWRSPKLFPIDQTRRVTA